MPWFWYLFGAVSTLAWKWQRYVYESKGKGIPFKQSTKTWFELQTVGAQTSWGATVGGVWLLGYLIINKEGAAWFASGVFAGIPALAPICFFIGALAEMIVPAMAKTIIRKLGGKK